MAMSVTAERDDGTLKRLRATPMPPVAYFLGKVGLVAISSTVQVALLLLVARVFFGVAAAVDGRPLGGVRARLRPRGVRRHGARHRVLVDGDRAHRRCRRHRPDAGAAVHLRGLHRLRRRAAVAAAGGVGVPAEVDRPGHALGVLPRRPGVRRDGRLVGDRPHRAGAVRLGGGRAGPVRARPSSGSSAAPRERAARHNERRDGDTSDLARGVRRDVAPAAAVLARRLRDRLGRRRRRDAHRRPGPARPGPVARAARRHRARLRGARHAGR